MSEVFIIGANNEIWRGSDTSEFYETEDWDDKIESFSLKYFVTFLTNKFMDGIEELFNIKA